MPSATAPLQRQPVSSSTRWGALAAIGMAALYAAIVAGASGSVGHLIEQVDADWYLLAPIMAGFGIQIGLVVELRRRHRMVRAAALAGTAGAGGSTVGMIACCMHHLAEFVPFIAVSGSATFVGTYRVGFMWFGLTVTAIGIAVALRRLRHLPATISEEGLTCSVH